MIKILKYGEAADSDIFARNEPLARIGKTVADIIGDVKTNGDAALMKYTRLFDKAELQTLEVTRQNSTRRYQRLTPAF